MKLTKVEFYIYLRFLEKESKQKNQLIYGEEEWVQISLIGRTVWRKATKSDIRHYAKEYKLFKKKLIAERKEIARHSKKMELIREKYKEKLH